MSVQDENDNAPAFGRPWYALEVPENQPAVELCTLRASDPDTGANGDLEYRITGEWALERLCVWVRLLVRGCLFRFLLTLQCSGVRVCL